MRHQDEIFIRCCTLKKNQIKSKDFEILMSAIESVVILGSVRTSQVSHNLLYVQSSLPMAPCCLTRITAA